MCSPLAVNNKICFHLPDGPEQIARDAKMATGGTDWSFKAIAWIYGYDWRRRLILETLAFPLGPTEGACPLLALSGHQVVRCTYLAVRIADNVLAVLRPRT